MTDQDEFEAMGIRTISLEDWLVDSSFTDDEKNEIRRAVALAHKIMDENRPAMRKKLKRAALEIASGRLEARLFVKRLFRHRHVRFVREYYFRQIPKLAPNVRKEIAAQLERSYRKNPTLWSKVGTT